MIPELILTAGSGSEIAIVSPWIWDVEFTVPRFGSGKNLYTQSKIRMSDLLIRMLKSFDYRILFMIRPNDSRTYSAVNKIVGAVPSQVSVLEFEYNHAKIIVTPTFALEMSANMITPSLYRNIESCVLVNNRFSNARKYLRDKFEIMV